MIKKLLIVPAIAFTVSACATGTNETVSLKKDQQVKVALSDAKSNKKYVCEKSMRTGSHLVKKRCWTKAQYEEQKRRSREMLERVKNNNTIGKTGGVTL